MSNEMKEGIHIMLDTKLPQYIPIPISMVGKDISPRALVVYAELLGRATLSQKNKMINDRGQVYIVYPVRQLSLRLNISESQTRYLLDHLCKKGYLRKERGGMNKPNYIYVLLPKESYKSECENPGAEIQTLSVPKNKQSDCLKINSVSAKKEATNKYNKQSYKTTYSYKEGESL